MTAAVAAHVIDLIAHATRRNRQLAAARAVVRAEKVSPVALREALRVLAESHKPDDRLIAERMKDRT